MLVFTLRHFFVKFLSAEKNHGEFNSSLVCFRSTLGAMETRGRHHSSTNAVRRIFPDEWIRT